MEVEIKVHVAKHHHNIFFKLQNSLMTRPQKILIKNLWSESINSLKKSSGMITFQGASFWFSTFCCHAPTAHLLWCTRNYTSHHIPIIILQWEYTDTTGKMYLLQTYFLSSHSHFTLFSSQKSGCIN